MPGFEHYIATYNKHSCWFHFNILIFFHIASTDFSVCFSSFFLFHFVILYVCNFSLWIFFSTSANVKCRILFNSSTIFFPIFIFSCCWSCFYCSIFKQKKKQFSIVFDAVNFVTKTKLKTSKKQRFFGAVDKQSIYTLKSKINRNSIETYWTVNRTCILYKNPTEILLQYNIYLYGAVCVYGKIMFARFLFHFLAVLLVDISIFIFP